MQEPLVTQEVIAESFRLVNDKGETRARLSTNADGDPAFVLYDKKGKPRLSVTVDGEESAGISLQGADESVRAAMFVGRWGSTLYLFSEESQVTIQTTKAYKPRPSVELRGESGTIELGGTKFGQGLSVDNSDGEKNIKMTFSDIDAKPEIVLYDYNGGRDRVKVWKL